MANIDRTFDSPEGFSLGETPVGIFTGTSDPSSGAGFDAPIGSIYQRNTGQVWLKNNTSDTAWIQVVTGTGGGFNPGKTVIVAKSGGDYTSIKAACDYVATQGPSSSNAWAVIVYPGIYAEDPITVPAFTNLVCAAPAGSAVIVANTTTSPIVTMGGYSTINGFLLQGATGAGGSAIYCPSTCTNYIIQNNIISNCTIGIKIVGAGTPISTIGNILTCQMSRAPGQTMTTAIDISAGALAAVASVVIFGTPISMITTGLSMNGAIVQVVGISFNYCTTAVSVIGGSSMNSSGINIRSCVTAISCDGSTTMAKFNSTIIEGCTTDLNLVNPAVTGYVVGAIDLVKTNIETSSTFFIQAFSDVLGEAGLKIVGDVDIGRHLRPAMTAMGQGGPGKEQQLVFQNTNQEAGTWTDITASAILYGGSFSVFSGTGANQSFYVGVKPHKYSAWVLDAVTTAMVGGAVVTEYWNGSAWTTIRKLETSGGTSYANQILRTVHTGVSIRFDWPKADWALKTVNGQSAYWIRIRITSAITTVPVVSRLLHIGSSLIVANNGYHTFFGDAEPLRDISTILLRETIGYGAVNEDVLIGNETRIAVAENERSSTAKDGSGSFFTIPQGLDTSRPLLFDIDWAPMTATAGNVEHEIYVARMYPGLLWDGTATQITASTIAVVGAGNNRVGFRTQVLLYLPDALAGETYAFSHIRDGSAGNPDDTLNGNIYLANLSITGYTWR